MSVTCIRNIQNRCLFIKVLYVSNTSYCHIERPHITYKFEELEHHNTICIAVCIPCYCFVSNNWKYPPVLFALKSDVDTIFAYNSKQDKHCETFFSRTYRNYLVLKLWGNLINPLSYWERKKWLGWPLSHVYLEWW